MKFGFSLGVNSKDSPIQGFQDWPTDGIRLFPNKLNLEILKMLIFKGPRFVPFRANLTIFGANLVIPADLNIGQLCSNFTEAESLHVYKFNLKSRITNPVYEIS